MQIDTRNAFQSNCRDKDYDDNIGHGQFSHCLVVRKFFKGTFRYHMTLRGGFVQTARVQSYGVEGVDQIII